MKFLVLKSLIIFLYLITTSLSYSTEQLNIKNIIIKKDPKSYKNVIFKDIDSNNLNLEDFEGKLILLNFWATWCLPCKEEMPSLDKLQIDKRLDNLKILPINIGQENLEKSKIFYKKLNIKNLEIYYDPSVKIASKFLLRGLPTTIVINKKGQEIARIIGLIDFNNEEFINWIKKFN
mgnify:FL=1|jgi:thiol-disulfide isomerase/thioredoxin